MFFKNLTMFRFPRSVDFSALAELLPAAQLKPVGPLEMSSRGFISPFGREESTVLHQEIGPHIWLAIGGEDKILPGAVINDMLAKKVAEIEEKEGRRPGGRARKRLKDDLIHELLPKAFVKPSRVDVIIDTENGVVFVNTSSRRAGENAMSEIRNLLGSFPALPLNAEVAPRLILTGWIAGEPLPETLALGEEAELKDPIEGGAQVKVKAQELRSDEIEKHLESGKQATKLAMSRNDHVSFVLGEDLIVRKLKFLDGAMDSLEFNDADGIRAELDARFALQALEMSALFLSLQDAFKISDADLETQRPSSAASAYSQPHTPETLRKANLEDAAARGGLDEPDPLYPSAVSVVGASGKASISFLQEQMRIGYNRAARLIEAMEAAGVVSLPDAGGYRTVLAAEAG